MTSQDYLLYDGRLPYIVEFPAVNILTTDLIIGGGVYDPLWTVQDLVDKNPQFFFAKGSSGIKTLHTIVMEPTIDLLLVGTYGPTLVNSLAIYVGPRYPIAFGFPNI